ncbi:MAG: DUF4143 domain-containing protein [Propionibacteriaceae bacterium]|nr:DUF4143 domain-containing protein [Propionibacteriaceae bacterium]
MAQGYLPRLVDRVLPELLATLPAISVVGPRAAGKSTSAQRLAASEVSLDRTDDAAIMRANPDAVLARLARPVLIDEWQEVPEVLGAVKRAVDNDPASGQFMMTGSVRIGRRYTWPATGRIVRQRTYGLTQGELRQSQAPLFVDRVRSGVEPLLNTPRSELTVFDYLEMAAVGGFPDMALHRHSMSARNRWLGAYLQEMRTNDVKLAGTQPDSGKFGSFLEAMALNSSRIIDQATLRDEVGISQNTAATYEKLLEDVFYCERVPAWRSNRIDRLIALPKRYLLDTGLMLFVMGLTADEAAHDAQALGAVLDTFVAAQLRPELAIQSRPVSLLHLRDKGGRHEIDLIIEFSRHRVVGLEIKATNAPGLEDARHLVWLRDRLGDDFIGGVVLHTGPMAFTLTDKIVAAPLAALWS